MWRHPGVGWVLASDKCPWERQKWAKWRQQSTWRKGTAKSWRRQSQFASETTEGTQLSQPWLPTSEALHSDKHPSVALRYWIYSGLGWGEQSYLCNSGHCMKPSCVHIFHVQGCGVGSVWIPVKGEGHQLIGLVHCNQCTRHSRDWSGGFSLSLPVYVAFSFFVPNIYWDWENGVGIGRL